MAGAFYLVFACSFGLATGIVGRIKGSSFLLWFVIGAVLPVAGLIAALLYRWEGREATDALPALRQDDADVRPGVHALRRGHRVGRAVRGSTSDA